MTCVESTDATKPPDVCVPFKNHIAITNTVEHQILVLQLEKIRLIGTRATYRLYIVPIQLLNILFV